MILHVDGKQEPSSDEYPSHIKNITNIIEVHNKTKRCKMTTTQPVATINKWGSSQNHNRMNFTKHHFFIFHI
jgi:hypothetical protein